MADKLTFIELHLHADNNELTLDSDLGRILGQRFGFDGSDESEPEVGLDTADEGESVSETLSELVGIGDEDADETTDFEADDADEDLDAEEDAPVSIGEPTGIDESAAADDAPKAAVVEIDRDVDPDEAEAVDGVEPADDESGGGLGRKLLTLLVVVGIALGVRSYLDGDDLEDEFEEL